MFSIRPNNSKDPNDPNMELKNRVTVNENETAQAETAQDKTKEEPLKKKPKKIQFSIKKSPLKIPKQLNLTNTDNNNTTNLRKKTQEIAENEYFKNNSGINPTLYPTLNDPNFNLKIAKKQEFNDTQYDGSILPIDEQANKLCGPSEFELAPHQLFVRNFLSFQTPYNSLFLNHGLGTGKTCSAIGICEEMRDYLKQLGSLKKIIIVASPNVQDNFKMQLFDERKLKLIDGLWNIKACTGNKFIKEVNPMNMKNIPKENIISQINRIINTYYKFYGYTEFANYITKLLDVEKSDKEPNQDDVEINKHRTMKKILALKKIFDNRLIVIDEFHNIRKDDDNKNKRVATALQQLVKLTTNMRLLLLSATPMFNDHREIIWTLNILNLNDNRAEIRLRDVFKKNGEFTENGRELLIRKANGYFSYVRGENPYTFPYKIYPSLFAENNTFKKNDYPRYDLTHKPITEPLNLLDVFLLPIGEYQLLAYKAIIKRINKKSLNYHSLMMPLHALNIVFPSIEIETERDIVNKQIDLNKLIGAEGLNNIMDHERGAILESKVNYRYKEFVIEKYGKIFSPENIGKYSKKIEHICKMVNDSDGIILVYSQYIEGGLIPVALALEEMGLTRAGNKNKSLLADPPKANKLKYAMITGNKGYSYDNDSDIKLVTNQANKDGSRVKVVLISKAGSEGLDFKYIRQIHILEPWYNMNRIEQIIGRGARWCSHFDLPLEKRNVQIFLYATLLKTQGITVGGSGEMAEINDGEVLEEKTEIEPGYAEREEEGDDEREEEGDDEREEEGEDGYESEVEYNITNEEAADLYTYRIAEKKARFIGIITRILKQVSVDCVLNKQQTQFTQENMGQTINIELSDRQEINYAVGDSPFTEQADYLEKCDYDCIPDAPEITSSDINKETYDKVFVQVNMEKIINIIKDLFKKRYFYKKNDILRLVTFKKQYPKMHIYVALDQLVSDPNEIIEDGFRRKGRLVNIGKYYLFQPLELINPAIMSYDRMHNTYGKNEKVNVNIKNVDIQDDAFVENKTDTQTTGASVERPKFKITNSKNIWNKIEGNFEDCFNETNANKKIKGNWYKICALTIARLRNYNSICMQVIENKNIQISNQDSIQNISLDDLKDLVISHIVEELNYNNKRILINSLYSSEPNSECKILMKKYFENNSATINGMKGYRLLNKNGVIEILVFKDNMWKPADKSNYRRFKDYYTNADNEIKTDNSTDIYGFMGYTDKTKRELTFKVVNQTNVNNFGARCDQSRKTNIYDTLNKLHYNYEIYSDSTNSGIKNLTRPQLCCENELLLRYFDLKQRESKRWFLKPEEYIAVQN